MTCSLQKLTFYQDNRTTKSSKKDMALKNGQGQLTSGVQSRDFPRKCVTAYNPTRRISNDRQQIKRFSHANGQ